MIIDEVMELCSTVSDSEETINYIKSIVDNSKKLPLIKYDYNDIMDDDYINKCSDQADAMVDIYYYCLNAASKQGFNLNPIFWEVHYSNMSKKDPLTGLFNKRSDGKILKPIGWMPPDIKKEIKFQLQNGSF